PVWGVRPGTRALAHLKPSPTVLAPRRLERSLHRMNDPCSMREPSQAEIARWKSYARQHNPCLTPSAATACRNQVDADGNWVLGHVHGRSLYERDEYGRTTFSFAVHVITPVLAESYDYRTMEP